MNARGGRGRTTARQPTRSAAARQPRATDGRQDAPSAGFRATPEACCRYHRKPTTSGGLPSPRPQGPRTGPPPHHTASRGATVHPTSITRGILRTAIVGAAVALILTLAVPAFAASGWKAAASGTGANLAGVAAPTAGLRWAVGAGGVIVASTDGGTTWAAQDSHATADLNGVAFVDAHNGWAVGAGGVIVATTDGGTTWAAQDSQAPARPQGRRVRRRDPRLGRRRRRRDRRDHRRRDHVEHADVGYGQRPPRGRVRGRDPRLGRRRSAARSSRPPTAPPGRRRRRVPPRISMPSPPPTRRTRSPSAPAARS